MCLLHGDTVLKILHTYITALTKVSRGDEEVRTKKSEYTVQKDTSIQF
jgi:hypothetical protein